MNKQAAGDKGFTLIELVVTLLIAAIMAVGIVSYIGDSVEGFAASGNRSKLAASGRTVIDRLALELHNAVPNSVRVSAALPNGDQCLEFIPFVAASSYLDAPFDDSGDSLRAVRFSRALEAEEPLYAIIFPGSPAELYEQLNPGPLSLIDSISDTPDAPGSLDTALDEPHRFLRRSPLDRLYVGREPVSFCLSNGSLYRYANYGFSPQQCTPQTPDCLPQSAPDRRLLSDQLDNTGLVAFRTQEASVRRNALVAFELNFTDRGDTVLLNHEILMRNVP